MCAIHPPEKAGLIKVFLGSFRPRCALSHLTYTQISAALAIHSAVAAASISDTDFTMIYEPAHWPSLYWKEKRGHIVHAAYLSRGAGLQSVLESIGGGMRLQSRLLRYPLGNTFTSSVRRRGQRTTAIMKSLPKCSKVMSEDYPHTLHMHHTSGTS